jgi:uncharacterized protein (DUF952 family)
MQPFSSEDAQALYIQILRVEEQARVLRRLAERFLPQESLDQLAYERQFPTETIYHITPLAYFEALPTDQGYLPEAYTKDGFIHCTRGADLMAMIATRHYRNVPGDFAMLIIDVRALISPLKYEALDPNLPFPFPHIYGPINRDAILEVVKMRRAADGTFLVPPFPSE